MPPQHADGITRPIGPPTTVGEILLAGLSLYGANAAAVIGVTVAIWLPIELLQSYYEYFVADASDVGRSFGMTIWIENLLGVIPIASVVAIGNAAMNGERPSIWFGLRSGLEAWPRMVGTRIIVGLITILGLVVFVVPGIYFAVRTTLAEQAAVIERMNPMASTQRSFQLTQGTFWRYFFLDAICVGFMFFVGALTQIPAVIFPEYNHWVLSAILALIVDAVSAWPVLVLVAAYWASARPGMRIDGAQDEAGASG